MLFTQDIYKLNKYAAYLHGASFVGVLASFLIKNEDANFNTDLFRLEITELTDGDREVSLEPKKVTKITTPTLKTLILLTFALTCIIHIFYASDGFGSGAYSQQLRLGRNSIRWLEYAVTSTMMILVLCIISGIKDYDSVVLICAANAVLMSFGYLVEMVPTKKAKIICLLTGFFSFSTLWVIILKNFYTRISEVQKLDNPNRPGEKRDVPNWVKMVLTPMLFWYASFGIVAIFYVMNYDKPGFNFVRYERYYIILSFLSKAFMGYYLAYGLTRPKADDL